MFIRRAPPYLQTSKINFRQLMFLEKYTSRTSTEQETGNMKDGFRIIQNMIGKIGSMFLEHFFLYFLFYRTFICCWGFRREDMWSVFKNIVHRHLRPLDYAQKVRLDVTILVAAILFCLQVPLPSNYCNFIAVAALHIKLPPPLPRVRAASRGTNSWLLVKSNILYVIIYNII